MKKVTQLIILFVLLLTPTFAFAATADHVVISEIKISGGTGLSTDEFVELYNPTEHEFPLAGWQLAKKTATSKEYVLAENFGDKVIPAHSFFLIAHPTGYVGTVMPDLRYSTTNSISDNNAVIVYDATHGIVDVVGLGSAVDGEGTAASNPAGGKSIERKARADSDATAMVEGGIDYFLGNGEDSGNNKADFIVRDTPEPQNANEDPEYLSIQPPAPNVPQPEPVPSSDSSSPVVTANRPPEASFHVSAEQTKVGNEVSFDASDSSDPDSDKLQFEWDFGDGKTGSGKKVQHSYAKPGVITAILRVSDSRGGSAERSVTITVTDYDYSDKILLSELLPDCAGADEQCEFIEIFNGDKRPVNLEGWQLTDTKATFRFPDQSTIESNGFIVVPRAKSKIVLNNEGDTVYLVNPAKKIMGGVTYGKATIDQSFARTDDTKRWQWTELLTPGAKNQFAEKEEEELHEPQDKTSTSEKENTPEINVNPITVTLSAVDESMIGKLVTISGEVETTSGGNIYLTDEAGGSLRAYIQKATAIKKPNLKAGDRLEITGVIDRTEAGLRLLPRKQGDIKVIPSSPSPANQGVVLGATTESNTVTVPPDDKKARLLPMYWLP